ncbi:MAG TPA: porin family protein [Bacteroidales bacterium]|nr:porin family protein [Bacteroidales bacterium]
MKKIVLALILFAAFAFTSNAQNEKFFRFGLHANTGLTWMKPDQDSLEYQGMKIGLGWGFIGELTIADNFSFATGFDINYMGGKLQKIGVNQIYPPDTAAVFSKLTSNYRFQFLDIPLTLKMKTNEINYITYFARIGGSIGICLNAKADEEYSPLSGSQMLSLNDQNLKEERNFFRANFLISGGLEYSLGGTTSALAELSFVNGLTYQLEDNKSIGNYIMLKFGIMF